MPTSAMNLVGTASASSGGADRIHLSGVTVDTGKTVALEIDVPFGLIREAQEAAAPQHLGRLKAVVEKGTIDKVPLP